MYLALKSLLIVGAVSLYGWWCHCNASKTKNEQRGMLAGAAVSKIQRWYRRRRWIYRRQMAAIERVWRGRKSRQRTTALIYGTRIYRCGQRVASVLGWFAPNVVHRCVRHLHVEYGHTTKLVIGSLLAPNHRLGALAINMTAPQHGHTAASV